MTGIELIQQERERQIHVEGWTPEHDDAHENREILRAAICYAKQASGLLFAKATGRIPPTKFSYCDWPWDKEWWKPSDDPIRNLVKAGALIAAEIDRLQRDDLRNGGSGV